MNTNLSTDEVYRRLNEETSLKPHSFLSQNNSEHKFYGKVWNGHFSIKSNLFSLFNNLSYGLFIYGPLVNGQFKEITDGTSIELKFKLRNNKLILAFYIYFYCFFLLCALLLFVSDEPIETVFIIGFIAVFIFFALIAHSLPRFLFNYEKEKMLHSLQELLNVNLE